MVSPNLGVSLSEQAYRRRIHQLDPMKLATIHMAIPVSGAAVQLTYFEKLISELDRHTDRFMFHIISQQSPSTTTFLGHMIGKPNVKLHVSSSHREVVELFEALYEHEVISLEVTKPSEQSFKALLKPRERGGSILLFSDPVGRQEWDNIRFLMRHQLLPDKQEQQELWHEAARGKKPSDTLLLRAKTWRALRLPVHSVVSAQFIGWCLEHKIFASMVRFTGYVDSPELSSKGVEQFWKRVGEHLNILGY